MNRKQNARQMLGVASNVTPEEITKAFQAKVSELSQKQLSPIEFRKYLDQLYAAYDVLTHHESSFSDSIDHFSYIDSYMDNYMKEMRGYMNNMFNGYHNQPIQANLSNQEIQYQPDQQIRPIRSIQYNQRIQPNLSNQEIQNQPQSYKYSRSFAKSISVDQNGNVIGSSNKVIQKNDKVFKEEKEFDSKTKKMHVKRYKPDGTVNEFEKPYSPKFNQKYLKH